MPSYTGGIAMPTIMGRINPCPHLELAVDNKAYAVARNPVN
jgi:hypothetical protein